MTDHQEYTNRLVGASEMARRLNLNKQTIYKMVRLREIPYIKLGSYGSQRSRILFYVEHVLSEIQRKHTIPARPTF
jgi:excisionase family DNA binding protein